MVEEQENKRCVFDEYPGPILWVENGTGIPTINREMAVLLGLQPESDIAALWRERIHSDDLGHFYDRIEAARKDRHPFTTEVRLLSNDHRYRNFAVLGTYQQRNDRSGEGVLCVFHRGHTGGQSIKCASGENEFFYKIMDAAPIAILQTDHEGKIIFVNPEAENILGVTTSAIVGKYYDDPTWKACDEHGVPFAKGAYPIATALEAKKPTRDNLFSICRPDGERRTLSIDATPILDERTEIVSVVVVFEDITEWLDAQHQLIESEKKYRNLFEKLRDGFALHKIICDDNGTPIDYRYIEVNPAFEAMLGLPAEAICGRTVKEILPEIEPCWIRTYGKVALTGEPKRFEDYTATLGKYFDILAYSPAKDYFAILAVDITEKKRVERELVQKEERYRLFMKNLQGIAYRLNEGDSRPVFIRGLVEKITGYRESEFESGAVDWQDLIPDEDLDRILSSHAEKYQAGFVHNREYRIRSKNGEIHWVLDIASAGWDHEKQSPYVEGMIYDITERKKIERELLSEHEKLASILTAMSDGVCIIDNLYQLKYANPVVVKDFGPQVDMHCYKYLNGLDEPCPWCKIRQAQDGIPTSWEWLHTRSGKTFDVYASPLSNENPSADVLILFHDVTEHRNLERTLEDERHKLAKMVDERTVDLSMANAALKRAARMKDEFLANMSHELRTPLTAILGLTEALRHRVYGEINPRQEMSLDGIEESGRHLLALINDILDLSKIEAGKEEIHLSPVRIGEICQASLRLIKQDAKKKDIKVTYDQDLNLTVMMADERRMKQILVNLLNNAVKFTPAGGEVNLSVRGDGEGKKIVFCIRDTGIGIAGENIEKIFQPFVQLDSRLAREFNGSGLGLALVRKMVEHQGGTIQVVSEPGKGSQFSIILPLTEVAEPEQMTDETQLDISTLIRKALLVDDSQVAIEQMTRYLTQLGIHSSISEKGDVFGVIEREGPEMIFLEPETGNGKGWLILQDLKNDDRTHAIPVVIVSIADDRARAIEMGAAGFLLKPVVFTDLKKVMLDALSRSRHRQQDVETTDTPNNERLVLIVDDNEMTLEVLADYLQIKRFQVEVARNGFQAVSMALEKRPALIVMDIQMPGMNGLDAIRRIREEPSLRNTPILALTTLVMPGDEERCMAAGADGYLEKPVSIQCLQAWLEKHIRSAHSMLENG